MKIEIIKITKPNNDVFYHLEKDGELVRSTVTMDEPKIHKLYAIMTANHGRSVDVRTVIKSKEI